MAKKQKGWAEGANGTSKERSLRGTTDAVLHFPLCCRDSASGQGAGAGAGQGSDGKRNCPVHSERPWSSAASDHTSLQLRGRDQHHRHASAEQAKQCGVPPQGPPALPHLVSATEDPGSMSQLPLGFLTHLLALTLQARASFQLAVPSTGPLRHDWWPWGGPADPAAGACCLPHHLLILSSTSTSCQFCFCVYHLVLKVLLESVLSVCLTRTPKQVLVQGESSWSQFPEAVYPQLKGGSVSSAPMAPLQRTPLSQAPMPKLSGLLPWY